MTFSMSFSMTADGLPIGLVRSEVRVCWVASEGLLTPDACRQLLSAGSHATNMFHRLRQAAVCFAYFRVLTFSVALCIVLVCTF